MPNLSKTQLQFTNLFRELLAYIRLWRQVRALGSRYTLGRIQVLELNDSSNFLSKWSLSGAVRGTNCTEDGRLYVKITDENPSAGHALVQVYMDAGQTLLVAQGSAADGAVVTLAAQNNSGLSGSVKLATITSSPSNIVLLLSIDETLKVRSAYDISTPGGVAAYKAVTARLQAMGNSMLNALPGIKNDIEQGYMQTKLREFLTSTQPAILNVQETLDSSGDVQIQYLGILADLMDAMSENTVAQSVKANAVSSGSPVYDSSNTGLGVLTIDALYQNLESGSLQLLCTSGVETALPETFDVRFISAVDNSVQKARQSLKTKQNWKSQPIGVAASLARTITESGDGGPQLTGWSVSGETRQNTDGGDLYVSLEAGTFAGGTNRRVRLYSDAARRQLVAEGLRTGDGVVSLAPQTGSGLSATVTLAYSGDNTGITLHLNAFAKGDVITVPLTCDRAGYIQTLFADIWGLPLPTSGSPTLPDSLIEEATDLIADVS